MKIAKLLSVLVIFIFITGCDENETPLEDTDTFDREQMLVNWADNIIVPGYENYVNQLEVLKQSSASFIENSNIENLESLRSSWLEAYKAWQSVSMFEIGKAEELTLRDFTNIFPANSSKIEQSILSQEFNLELPSSRDQQGFPALDYLLFGIGISDQNILEKLNDENHKVYLNALVDRLFSLGSAVRDDWSGYRDTFVSNNGSDAGSSVNKLVNDYMFYYEKALRAGKIGIPAGVFSSGTLSDRVEGLYSREYSKELFQTSLQATIDFFNGVHFNSTQSGESLDSYLDYLETISSSGEELSAQINTQFQSAMSQSDALSNNLFEQVETDNSVMLSTYDELQKNVVLLKVDMFQALNIQVDFVDADGD